MKRGMFMKECLEYLKSAEKYRKGTFAARLVKELEKGIAPGSIDEARLERGNDGDEG